MSAWNERGTIHRITLHPRDNSNAISDYTPKQELKALKTTSLSTHKRQAVVVLGMHRSGTSALARVLNLLGCAIPHTLIEKDESNAAGYWESLVISRFNDKILEAGGSVWHDWHEFNPGWLSSVVSDAFISEAVQLLSQEYGDAPLILLKDPRVSILFPFWRLVFERAGISPHCVIIQRNPMEVAASLGRRNGFSAVRTLLIWLRYTLDAERFSRGLPRDFTTYENLLSDFRDLPARWETHLNLGWPRKSDRVIGELSNFLSGNLRHHNLSGPRFNPPSYLSPWIARVYETLRSWATQGENIGQWEVLDSVYQGLSAAEKPFSPVVREIDNGVRTVNELRDELEKEKIARKLDATESEKKQQKAIAQLTMTETQHESALHQVEEQFKSEISGLQKKLDEAQAARDQATGETAQLRETVAAQIADMQKKLVETQAARDQATGETAQLRETVTAQIADMQKKLVEAQTARDLVTGETEQLRETVAAQIADMQKKLSEKEAELVQATGETTKLRQTVAAEIEDMQTKLGETKAARDQATRETEQLRETVSAQIADMQKMLVETKTARDEAVDETYRLRECFEDEKKKLEDLQWVLIQTQSELRQRAHEATETAGELADARKLLTGLTKEKDVLSRSLSEAGDCIAVLRQDFVDAQNASEHELHLRFDEIAHLTKSYVQLEAEKKALKSKLSNVIADILKIAEKPWRPSPLVTRYKMLLLRHTGIFDPEWYLDVNPDVRASGMDPALHFVRHGFDEGRSPLPEIPKIS